MPLIAASAVHGDGVGERAVLVIDPTNRESLEVGHYYMNARNIPPENVVYMKPTAADWKTFRTNTLPAFLSALEVHGIDDHVDFAIIPPGGTYRISATGVSDQCFPVEHFSTSALYTLAFEAEDIQGGIPSMTSNEYHSIGPSATAFDSQLGWFNGSPNQGASAKRYLIGTMLGYTGNNGNTREEIIDLIDRSVLADGTHPAGTVYYMETTDEARSGPRDPFYPQAVSDMAAVGGSAQHLFDVLPTADDCLGIMTGWAAPDIDNADLTLLPGSFADHLTSFAGFFAIGSQTKMSRWIAKGASGSSGAVEEPCNFNGKFPTTNVHVFYRQGLTLGEAAYRSLGFAPFQILLYGDPLTRPFTYIPDVTVADAPAGPVAGTLTLTPAATTSHPTATIAEFELLIDGRIVDTIAPGASFAIDTTRFGDGFHDVRIVSTDDTDIAATGLWHDSIEINNSADAVMLSSNVVGGSLSSSFDLTVTAEGGPYDEIRIVQNSRVLAASDAIPASITLYGWNFGGGPSTVYAEGVKADRTVVRSEPIAITIVDTDGGSPSGGVVPVAYSYTKHGRRDRAFLVELPASFSNDYAQMTYSLIEQPSQATVIENDNLGYVIVQPNATIFGPDQLTFQAVSPDGASNIATVNLIYGGSPFNDTCATAELILDGSFPFDTIDAATDGETEPGECSDIESDIWYRYIAQCTGLVTIDLCDVDYDAVMTIHAGICPDGADPVIHCDAGACESGGAFVSFLSSPGLYRIRIGGNSGATGFGTLNVKCNPCPADCAGNDENVDIQDLLGLLSKWGTGGNACDFTGGKDTGPDGTVDVQDLLGLLGSWGACK